MAQALPEQSTALATKHNHLGKLFTEAVFTTEAGVQLLPVLGIL